MSPQQHIQQKQQRHHKNQSQKKLKETHKNTEQSQIISSTSWDDDDTRRRDQWESLRSILDHLHLFHLVMSCCALISLLCMAVTLNFCTDTWSLYVCWLVLENIFSCAYQRDSLVALYAKLLPGLSSNERNTFKTTIVLPSPLNCLHIYSCLIYADKKSMQISAATSIKWCIDTLLPHPDTHTTQTAVWFFYCRCHPLVSLLVTPGRGDSQWKAEADRWRITVDHYSWAQHSPVVRVRGHLRCDLEKTPLPMSLISTYRGEAEIYLQVWLTRSLRWWGGSSDVSAVRGKYQQDGTHISHLLIT